MTSFIDKKKVTLSDCLEEMREIRKRCDEFEEKINSVCKEYWEKRSRESTTRWRAREGEKYYYFCGDGEICADCDGHYEVDTGRYNLGNYFQTKEEAEEVIEKMRVHIQLKDLAFRLNKGKKINWDNSMQRKYCINLNYSSNVLVCLYANSSQSTGQIYCLDSSFLDEAIKEIGEENLRKLFE